MPKDPSQWDVTISYEGVDGHYKLNTSAETNVLQWYAGLVEELVPQQNTSTFSYEAMPASLSSPLTFESWHRGAGNIEILSESEQADPDARGLAYHGYSYSRGVDASWNRLQLSPERQEQTGVTGTVLGHYTSPTFGEYLWTTQRVYQFSGGSWVQRYDAASDVITDVLEYGNTVDTYLLVARGDNTDIVYSNDAVNFNVWTDERATFLAVRGHTALEPILVGITSKGAVATATTIAGGMTAADQVGSRGSLVKGVEVANDVLVLFKQDGIYTFDGADVSEVIDTDLLYRDDNGSAHVLWINGRAYSNYGNRLIEFDPINSTLETVYSMSHPEINGTIETVTGDTGDLYLTILNADGNRYIMKGAPHDSHWHWHTWVYLGSSLPGSRLHVAAGGRVHTTNPVVIANDDYYILPRDALRPEDDEHYRFDSAGGFIVGPLVDAGARVFKKFLSGGRVVLEDSTAARPVNISYGLNQVDTSPTALMTAVQDGLTTETLTSEVSFTRVHYYATLSTGDNRHSPRVLAIVLDSTPMPPRRRRFTFVVEVEHLEPRRGSGDSLPYSYMARESHLFNAVDKYVTLTDPLDRTFSVKIRDVSGLGLQPKVSMHGGAHSFYSAIQVTADEITETTPATPLAIWDQSEWDDGSVYGE